MFKVTLFMLALVIGTQAKNVFEDVIIKTSNVFYDENNDLVAFQPSSLLKSNLHTQTFRLFSNEIDSFKSLSIENRGHYFFNFKDKKSLEHLSAHLLQEKTKEFYIWGDYLFNSYVCAKNGYLFIRGEGGLDWFLKFVKHLKDEDDVLHEHILTNRLVFDYMFPYDDNEAQKNKTNTILSSLKPSTFVEKYRKLLNSEQSLIIAGKRIFKHFSNFKTTHLDLSGSRITVCKGHVFKPFFNLKKLDVYFNSFPELDIGYINFLEELDAQSSGITKLIGLKNLHYLKRAIVSFNDLSNLQITESFEPIEDEDEVQKPQLNVFGTRHVQVFRSVSPTTQHEFIFY